MPKSYSMAPFFTSVDDVILKRKTVDAVSNMSGGFACPHNNSKSKRPVNLTSSSSSMELPSDRHLQTARRPY